MMQAHTGARILVVEDDPALSDVVCTYLGDCGYMCTPAFSGTEARLLLGGTGGAAGERTGGTVAGGPVPFDLVICDLMLPGLAGEEVVALVRSRGPVPVIVTSARAQVADRVSLLRSGADDYLVKPFDLEELLARVEACLRRARSVTAAGPQSVSTTGRPLAGEWPAATTGRLHFGLWEADEEARTFLVAGEPLKLTRTEFDILCALMRQPRKVFSKRELFERVWHEDAFADDKTIATHVGNIRAKLRPSGTQDYLQTVWGIGFKLAEG